MLLRSVSITAFTAILLAPTGLAQNWVGFGDNAWPAGNTVSTRGTIPANGSGFLAVRLDAWEHGGWGYDPAFPGTRTIDAVKFYAHTSVPATSINLYFMNEGPPHIPGAGGLVASPTIAVGATPVLHTATFAPVRINCTGAGDMFILFELAAGDGVQIGQVDATTDRPGAAYALPPFAYGPPVSSHCLSIPQVPWAPFTYLPGPAQFYVDVGQALNLASGVGGTVTNQTATFPNSAPAPGTSGFLSGSFPDCTGFAGGRTPATPDFVTMKIRAPTVCAPGPGSIVLFVLAAAPIVPCGSPFELPLGLFFPGACSSGVLCIDPTTIFLETIVPLSVQGDAMVSYGPLQPSWRGFGATHQAFILDPTTTSVHAGPCDRQEL